MYKTIVAAALLGVLIAGPITANAQDAASQAIEQNAPAYAALETVRQAANGLVSLEAGSPAPIGALSREQFGRRIAFYLNRFYVTLPTDQFTRVWQSDPKAFDALRSLAAEFGPETIAAGADAKLVQTIVRPPFPDVPRAHWAAGAIERLRVRGIVIGNARGTYNLPQNR